MKYTYLEPVWDLIISLRMPLFYLYFSYFSLRSFGYAPQNELCLSKKLTILATKIKFPNRFLILIFCSIISYQANSQDTSTINVHLFPEGTKEVKFKFSYGIDAEGENTVGKTIFESIIRFSQTSVEGDIIVLDIKADSTTISNPETIKDGEAALLYAMIGSNMKLKCRSNGQLIEVLNKEEVISEFKNGIQGMSERRKDMIVQSMLSENEALFFMKIYEFNYGLLLKYLSKDLIVPLESKRDSLIEETAEVPKSTLEAIEKNTRQLDKIVFSTTVIQKSNEFSQKGTGYEMITKPIDSNTEQILTTTDSGIVQRLSSVTVIKREGMVMKREEEVVNEIKPMTQYLNIEYTRL